MLKVLHHGLNMGCKSQARMLKMFMPAEVTVSKATTTGTKNCQFESYLARATTVDTCRQAEAEPTLTCLRKTAQKPPPTYCRWIGDAQFSLVRVCVVGSQTLQSQSSNPAAVSGEAQKKRASAFRVMSSFTFCFTSVYSACTQCWHKIHSGP